jgi:1,4-dihydroxy-2-naphthoyl-CoA hydrolase
LVTFVTGVTAPARYGAEPVRLTGRPTDCLGCCRYRGGAGPTVAEVRVEHEQDGAAQMIAEMNKISKDTLAGRMGVTFTGASAERVTGTMPVDGNTQPYGLLHGGASCVLAETLGSVGAALTAGPGRYAVGVEISATHHRAAASGEVTGVATRLHAGRTIASYEIVISDDHGRRVCTARLTCLLRDQVPPGGHAVARDG